MTDFSYDFQNKQGLAQCQLLAYLSTKNAPKERI